MDPEATIKRAFDALGEGDWDEVEAAISDYEKWRRKGGYEPTRGDSRMADLKRFVNQKKAFLGRKKNPKSRRFMKPKLRRVFVEDDGHVFAKQDGTGYIGRIKNPVRPLKRDKATARGLVKRYGSKSRAREVAGGMIGKARSPAQREKFVAVRKALNPKRRKKNPNPPFLIEAKAKHWDAWRPYAGAWTKERAAQVANALGKQGLYARVMK